MNSIDKMLMRNAKKICIRLAPNPSVFCVLFAASPSPSTWEPLGQLKASNRFTVDALVESGNLGYQIQCINAIPRDQVVDALIESWGDFEVTIQEYQSTANGYVIISN